MLSFSLQACSKLIYFGLLADAWMSDQKREDVRYVSDWETLVQTALSEHRYDDYWIPLHASHPTYRTWKTNAVCKHTPTELMPNQKCIMVDSSWTNSDDCYSSSRSMPSWATTPRYISWIRYHDANKSLVWKPNTEAVNATTSERAAIICSMGSRILSTQLSPSSLAYCTWAEA
jgi:hypothetical protein